MWGDADRFVRMRTIDLFADTIGIDSRSRERAERTFKSGRAIFTAARAGRAAGSKANAAFAWLEAGFSVLDAINSYATYRQAREVTRQLEAEAALLELKLNEMREQWGLSMSVAAAERQSRRDEMELERCGQREELRIHRQQYEDCKSLLLKMGQALVKLRRDGAPADTQLTRLEKAYYRLMHEQVQAAVSLIDS